MFRMDPKPTFERTVTIPEPGGPGQKIRVVYNYLPMAEYDSLRDAHFGAKVADAERPAKAREFLCQLIADWKCEDGPEKQWEGMPEPFSEAALGRLMVAWPRAQHALVIAYREEMYIGTPFGMALGN